MHLPEVNPNFRHWDSLMKWRALNPTPHREEELCYWVHWGVWPGQWGHLWSGPEQHLQEASCCHGFRFLPNAQFTTAEGLCVSRKGLKLSLWWGGERGLRTVCAGCFPAGDIHNGKWCHIGENAEKFFKQQKNRALAKNQKEIGVVKMCVYIHAWMFIIYFCLASFQESGKGQKHFYTVSDCGSSMRWAEMDELCLASASFKLFITVL